MGRKNYSKLKKYMFKLDKKKQKNDPKPILDDLKSSLF